MNTNIFHMFLKSNLLLLFSKRIHYYCYCKVLRKYKMVVFTKNFLVLKWSKKVINPEFSFNFELSFLKIILKKQNYYFFSVPKNIFLKKIHAPQNKFRVPQNKFRVH